MDVDPVCRQTHHMRRHGFSSGVVLSHYVTGDHPPGFPNVDLVGPSAGLHELILAESEARGLLPDRGGNSGIGGQKMQEATQIVFVPLADLLALAPAGFRISLAAADEVGGRKFK